MKLSRSMPGLEAAPSFLGDLIDALTERGRSLLRQREGRQVVAKEALPALGEVLISRRGEASGVALAQTLLAGYAAAEPAVRLEFLKALADRFGPDRRRVEIAWKRCAGARPDAIEDLHAAAEPRRQELVRRLNLAPGGTSALVRMREELLGYLPENPDLRRVDDDFGHLFSSWFNRGFLVLRPIDWTTPANILEKIIRYEAVHEIENWDDLRNRLEPEDRRCYGFFHPQLVDEPLIFVEVALTRAIPDAVGPLLDLSRTPTPASETTTAVFYSISNTQKGLGGVSFGNFLIKQVVENLKRELPNLKTFVTLSPVPGFAAWLARERKAETSSCLDAAARQTLASTRPTRMERESGNGGGGPGGPAPRGRLLLPQGEEFEGPNCRSGGAVPSRERRAPRAAELPRRHFAEGPEAGARAHGELPLRARRDRDEPRGVRRERHGGRLRRGPQDAADRSPLPRPGAGAMTGSSLDIFSRSVIDPRYGALAMNANLFDRLERSIADPEKSAITSPAGESVSYADLISRSGRLSNVLAARGVKPGDRVAVQVEKSITALVLYLATVRVGAVYLPLNTAYTLAELEYFIGDAEPASGCLRSGQARRHRADRRKGRSLRRDAGCSGSGDTDRRREG